MPAATGHFQRAAEGKGGQAMWQKKICLMALALAASLGMADDGDDDKPPPPKGNWFTRIFVKDAPPKAALKKMDTAPKVSPEVLRQRAMVEWLRRTEVCDKLRAIAESTGDKDLARKAEALTQRAWDIYQKSSDTPGRLSPDEQLLEGRLGMDAGQRSRSTESAGGTAAVGESRTRAWRD
jgi:hypothetical protein